jgi:hypothetical protein
MFLCCIDSWYYEPRECGQKNVTAKTMDISTGVNVLRQKLQYMKNYHLENEFASALEDTKQIAVYLDIEPVIFSPRREIFCP